MAPNGIQSIANSPYLSSTDPIFYPHERISDVVPMITNGKAFLGTANFAIEFQRAFDITGHQMESVGNYGYETEF